MLNTFGRMKIQCPTYQDQLFDEGWGGGIVKLVHRYPVATAECGDWAPFATLVYTYYNRKWQSHVEPTNWTPPYCQKVGVVVESKVLQSAAAVAGDCQVFD